MIKDQCSHEWTLFVGATGTAPAKYKCSNCDTWLTASDVYELETLKYIKGFQKYLSIIAIIISIIALLVSVFYN